MLKDTLFPARLLRSIRENVVPLHRISIWAGHERNVALLVLTGNDRAARTE